MSVLLNSESSHALFADFGRAIWQGQRAATGRLAKRCAAPAARTVAGLHIHASTTHHTLARALTEAVPSVAAVLSEREWAAVAREFVARHPPRRAALSSWGDEVADFLQGRGAEDEVIGLAQLDRAAMTAFFAADHEPITAAALAGFAPSEIQRIGLTTHPSLQRLHVPVDATKTWLEQGKIPQVEQRREADADGSLVVMMRPDARVRMLLVSPATDAMLGALLHGATLIEAYEQAMGHNSQFDFQSVLAGLFADGVFIGCGIRGLSNDHAD